MSQAEGAGWDPMWLGRRRGLAKHRPDIQNLLWLNGSDVLSRLSATRKLQRAQRHATGVRLPSRVNHPPILLGTSSFTAAGWNGS